MSDEMIEHIESCEHCIKIDECIEFLEKELKGMDIKNIVEELHNKQSVCYENSFGGYDEE